MSAPNANVQITVADGKTLEQFQRLIEARQKWLGETAQDSIAAVAITALKSIRAATKIAKEPERIKVDVQATGYIPDFYREGGFPKKCLRTAQGKHAPRYQLKEKEYLVFPAKGTPLKGLSVFKFADYHSGKTYYIVAANKEGATEKARGIISRRIKNFRGLARRALGLLMAKTSTLNGGKADNVSGQAELVANRETVKTETKANGKYALSLRDSLLYATGAIKGGESEINTALHKSMNAATAKINHLCRNLLTFQPLPTPFPEVRRK